MVILLTIFKLLPAIIGSIQAVEAAIPLPSSGKAKLDLVLGTVSDVYGSAQQVTPEVPAGQLLAVITQIVTRVVGTFNALGIFKKSA